MVRAGMLVAIVVSSSARAGKPEPMSPGGIGRDLCTRGASHHGAPIDLDVKDADVHDVMRLLADVGQVNIVVSDEVTGKVTLRLHRVAWDLAACTIAAVHHLAVTVQDNVILVRKAS